MHSKPFNTIYIDVPSIPVTALDKSMHVPLTILLLVAVLLALLTRFLPVLSASVLLLWIIIVIAWTRRGVTVTPVPGQFGLFRLFRFFLFFLSLRFRITRRTRFRRGRSLPGGDFYWYRWSGSISSLDHFPVHFIIISTWRLSGWWVHVTTSWSWATTVIVIPVPGFILWWHLTVIFCRAIPSGYIRWWRPPTWTATSWPIVTGPGKLWGREGEFCCYCYEM